MKKLFVMAALVLSSVGAFAQYQGGEFTIQPKVGLNATSTTAEKGKFKAGFVGGVEGEYHINKLIGLSAGVLYSQEGAKFEKSDLGLNDDLIFKMNYINVPILANFYVANGLAVKAGVQAGFKVSAKAKCGNAEYDLNDAQLSISGIKTGFDAESVNISIPVGISYEYANFCLDARYNIGVSDALKTETKVGGVTATNNNSSSQVFQLTLGYKFAL